MTLDQLGRDKERLQSGCSLSSKDLNDPELLDVIRTSEVQSRVAFGLVKYFQAKGVTYNLDQFGDFLSKVGGITGNVDYFKSNFFRYLIDSTDYDEVNFQMLENMKFWVELFGIDFFARSARSPDARKTFYRAPIPDSGCVLTCKGGSGMGTFSMDLAIADEAGDSRKISGELWRLGIDSDFDRATGERSLRIIRTGSGVSSDEGVYDSKRQVFRNFVRRMNILPQRALGFLALYLAHDLGVQKMKHLSLPGVRDKHLILNPASGVNFDYDRAAESLGFNVDGRLWHEIDDIGGKGMYDALVSPGKAGSGMKRHELEAMEPVIAAFREIERQGSPLRVCSRDTREELANAINAFGYISGKFSDYSTN